MINFYEYNELFVRKLKVGTQQATLSKTRKVCHFLLNYDFTVKKPLTQLHRCQLKSVSCQQTHKFFNLASFISEFEALAASIFNQVPNQTCEIDPDIFFACLIVGRSQHIAFTVNFLYYGIENCQRCRGSGTCRDTRTIIRWRCRQDRN